MKVNHLKAFLFALVFSTGLGATISAKALSSSEIETVHPVFDFYEESGDVEKEEVGFYTVSEKAVPLRTLPPTLDPFRLLEEFKELAKSLRQKAGAILLLNFDFHNKKFADYDEPYNRSRHFGTWVRDRQQGSCLNTRGVVLKRDSRVPIKTNASGCTVIGGEWDDPYSGRVFTEAQDVQIDHVVPLKNAYISGAYQWSKQKRCLYFNFLGNEYHLLSVMGRENMSKGDKTPEKYMPPNPAYQCQFLAEWLKIKLIWTLGFTASEKAAVEELVRKNRCSTKDLIFTAQQLNEQRQFMQENMSLCVAQ